MKKDSKASYLERKLSKALDDNKALHEENERLRSELKVTQVRLDDSEAACKRITDAYENNITEHAESVERLYEARIAYEEALEEVKAVMKEYKENARRWISAIKKTGRAV